MASLLKREFSLVNEGLWERYFKPFLLPLYSHNASQKSERELNKTEFPETYGYGVDPPGLYLKFCGADK